MRPFPTAEQVRGTVSALIARDRVAKAHLSRAMGHPDRFLSTYVRQRRPEWLEPRDRDYLARWFNVDTFELGDRSKSKPG
jgi:hypothetical protein